MKKYWSISLALPLFCLAIYYFFPEPPLDARFKPTRIVVFKSARRMDLYGKTQLLKSYRVSLGRTPVGDKHFEGDNKTPQGQYVIFDKNPHSVCYKNLGISYPNEADRQTAQALGRPVGGDIKIHGLPNGRGFFGKFHRLGDWTNGCIAVTDAEIDELYAAVAVGTPITINP